MTKIEHSIDVNVPLTTAYNQWTQFEQFPAFMHGVKRVDQLDDRTLEWTAQIAGKEETWTAEIYEQEPDESIAWRSTTGARTSGRVSFQEIGANTTRVTLSMDWQPSGAVEKVGDALGLDDRQVEGDLKRFKEFIEGRGTETGAWRGEISGGVQRGG